jgi:hypothetical protein
VFVGTPAPEASGHIRLALNDFEQSLRGVVALLGDYSCWSGAGGDCLLSVQLGGRINSKLLVTNYPGGLILTESAGLDVPPVELTIPLDELCDPRGASRAAFLLARDLEQDLGVPEPVVLQIDGDVKTIS